MERTLAPRRPWLTVVAFLLLVVVVGIAAKSLLPRLVEPEEAELRVRCRVAGDTPLEGLEFRVYWNRALPDRPGSSESGIIEFDPPRSDPRDPNRYFASVAPSRTMSIGSDRPRLSDLLGTGTMKLDALSKSHGSVWKEIDSLETEIEFEAQASLIVRIDPPLDPNDLERWFVRLIPKTKGKEFFPPSLYVWNAYRDGAFHCDAIQPGRYRMWLDRMSKPRANGISRSGYNESTVGESSPFARIVELAPGRNEIVLPRQP